MEYKKIRRIARLSDLNINKFGKIEDLYKYFKSIKNNYRFIESKFGQIIDNKKTYFLYLNDEIIGNIVVFLPTNKIIAICYNLKFSTDVYKMGYDSSGCVDGLYYLMLDFMEAEFDLVIGGEFDKKYWEHEK